VWPIPQIAQVSELVPKTTTVSKLPVVLRPTYATAKLEQSGVSFAVVEWGNKAIDEQSNYLHNNPVEEGSVFKAEQYIMVVPSTTPEVKDCLISFRFNYLPHNTIVRQQRVLRHIKKIRECFHRHSRIPERI
jgi:hypothetical protein